jgi:hypothetical protein
MGSYPTHFTPALSQVAHDGSRWSQRFLRSLQRLQALTLRNDEADELGVVGDAGLTAAAATSCGELASSS